VELSTFALRSELTLEADIEEPPLQCRRSAKSDQKRLKEMRKAAPCRDRLDSVELCSTSLTGYATSEPCLCASFAVTGEVIGNCNTVAR
jgi:hypothetical protein